MNEILMIFLNIMKILITIIGLVYITHVKNDNTLTQRTQIENAIKKYNKTTKPYKQIPLTNMEPYNKTLLKLWNWGHKNILPKSDYEKIEKYL